MQLFLDDLRQPWSQAWTVVRDPVMFLDVLRAEHERVVSVALDFDLGALHITGDEVCKIIGTEQLWPRAEIILHSSHGGARDLMAAILKHYKCPVPIRMIDAPPMFPAGPNDKARQQP